MQIPTRDELKITIKFGNYEMEADAVELEVELRRLFEKHKDIEGMAEQASVVAEEFMVFFNSYEGAQMLPGGGVSHSQAIIMMEQLGPEIDNLKKKRMPYLASSQPTDTKSSETSSQLPPSDSGGPNSSESKSMPLANSETDTPTATSPATASST